MKLFINKAGGKMTENICVIYNKRLIYMIDKKLIEINIRKINNLIVK